MGLSNKKCLFLVQGEGRGHMTQSISMKQLVEKSNMTVCEVLIGKSKQRKIPQFYYDRINIPVTSIESPNMATGKNKKAIKTLPSLFEIVLRIPQFIRSLWVINRKIKEHKPDVIINFYEPLAGLYYLLFRPNIPMICIGHHYMFNHPDFEMPEGNFLSRLGLKLYTGLISIGAKKKLALSFYPFDDCKEKSIYVIPPLLRHEVLTHPTRDGEYLLVYLLNNGYMEDIIKWHNKNPQIKLHCFVDNKDIVDSVPYDSTLSFHQINDKKFLEMMANSKGLVSTAGFESVCEAMYLGKPVFMVPVEGHYEQFCNSIDATRAGAGINDKAFEIDRFLKYIAEFYTDNRKFKEWAKQSPLLTMKHIESVLQENTSIRHLRPYPIFTKKWNTFPNISRQ
jgi:uncharacterized protein (TIGR00661 family)